MFVCVVCDDICWIIKHPSHLFRFGDTRRLTLSTVDVDDDF